LCNPVVADLICNLKVAEGGAVEVVREVVFDTSPEEVWEALTDPGRLEEWFANDVEFDLEQGGVFRWDDGEVRRAVVEEVDPERQLTIRWWDPAMPDEGEVTFTLEEIEEGTRLVVTETAPCEWAWALEARALAADALEANARRPRLLCSV
jgi:uncharacterized protein YndB with AHSA1/START domain